MAVWHQQPTVEGLNQLLSRDMVSRLGMEFTEVGDDFLRARLPVDERTQQPYGLLHGGVSCVVAESMGSLGSALCVDAETHYCVGVDINASHLRSASRGYVYAETRPLRIGRRNQVWETRITGEDGRLICVARLTTAVIER
jgi:1,4-dihydroxy-2-naphthoyl-CoA hydrolase